MERFSIGILVFAVLLTACGGGGGGSSISNGTGNQPSSVNSSSVSSSSEIAIAAANITITPGAQQFTIAWSQLSGQQYNLFVFDSPTCLPAAYSQCPTAIKSNNISPPYTQQTLENKKNYWVYLEAVKGSSTTSSPAHFVRSDNNIFDATITKIQLDKDGTTYLGGDFRRYGLPIGNGYVADATSGMPQKFPFINGLVRASVSDGKGGWYIGGDFTSVESEQRAYLAHILPDGSLDSWNPIVDGSVSAMAFVDSTLYVTGTFHVVNNQPRYQLAAFTSSGTLTDWAPSVSGFIHAITLFNNKIYVAGSFNGINGLPRTNLAVINKDGTSDNWRPNINGSIYTLLSTSERLYVGGRFSEINNQPRSALAAFDNTGSLTNWKPLLSNSEQPAYVSAMVEHNSLIHIAGNFITVNGLLRTNIAALDAANKLTDWHPEILKDGMVSAMAVAGNQIYVGGVQLLLQNNRFYDFIAIDVNGMSSSLPTTFSHRIYSISAFANKIFLGGELGMQNPQARTRLAALDKEGNLTSWNPFTNGEIYSLLVSDNFVYVAGKLNSVNGAPRGSLIAITKGQTGNVVTDATPDIAGHVMALSLADNKLYLAGSFYKYGTSDAMSVGAIDINTGKLLDWKPSINGSVFSLAATNERVYVGGEFSNVNGESRSNLAAFNSTGVLESWNPIVDQYVTGITAYQQTIYIRGGFLHVNGQVKSGIAALDLNGTLQPFQSEKATGLEISILKDKIYYANFYNLGNGLVGTQISRTSLDGKDEVWSLKFGANSYVNTITNDGTSLYIGGMLSDENGKLIGPFLKVSP